MEKDLSGVGLNALCRRQCGETRHVLSSIRTRAPDSAAFFPKYASRSALAAARPLSRCEETKGLHLHFRHLRTHTRGNSEGSKNRSEKFRDIALVTTQNFHRCTLSVPPRLFASRLSPHDRECPSSQKIFPTQSLYAPATSTQPQRRNTDVRGRSYHVLKLFTPRPGQIRPDSEIRPDLVEWGVNGRLTSYATSHVESVTFPSSHREKFVRGERRSPGQAGGARRTSLSEGGVTSSGVRRHTSRRITLARPRLGGRLGVRRRHRPAPLRLS